MTHPKTAGEGAGQSKAPLSYDPSDPDKMRLPGLKTCGDCVHMPRCNAIFGRSEDDDVCDWSPSRFSAATRAATQSQGDEA